MNTVKKNLPMWQYTVYISAIILMLCGLTLLLSSCAQEVAEGMGELQPGNKITVNFTLNGVIQGNNEVVTRNQSSMYPETVVIPLDDGLCAVATLEADLPDKARAITSNLDENTLLRIVAYEDGTIYHTHADYKVVGGFLIITDNKFEVAANKAYKFVAYSCNSTTFLPDHDDYSIPNIDPSVDLLWGCYPETGTHPITESDHKDIPITMSHRFSQVKIQATTEAISNAITITNIDDVSITSGKMVNITLHDGTLEAINDITQDFSFAGSVLELATIISNPRTVFTNNAVAFQVNIGSLTLKLNDGNPKTYTNLIATFNKQLQSGISYTIKIRFKKDETYLGLNDDMPVNVTTYTGAFWKANQKGERLIRIDMGTNAANQGAWTAKVAWVDPRFGNVSEVVLSTDMIDNTSLAARGISFTTDMNPDAYGAPESYPVTGNNTTVGGTVNSSNRFIFFRVGLRSYYTPTTAHPARYAVILLTYNNGARQQRIFVRQGEDADYLMTPDDRAGGDMNANSRPAAKKFAVYNLTATTLDATVNMRGAVFVNYPTQAGALFQYANTYTGTQFLGGIRWAYNPHTLNPPALTWQPLNPSVYWDMLAANHEISPVGYRRPYEGVIHRDEPCTDLNDFEMRQSLYLNPRKGYNTASETSNSMWGYYADGFFDRRRIVDNNNVAHGTRDIAYIGELFYNPIQGSDRYNASLFFPAAGWRYPDEGVLVTAGSDGSYWSASTSNMSLHYSLGMIFRSTTSGPWQANQAAACSIRPVAE